MSVHHRAAGRDTRREISLGAGRGQALIGTALRRPDPKRLHSITKNVWRSRQGGRDPSAAGSTDPPGYSTVIVRTPTMMAQLYEMLNNWRLIHLDGRPLPANPEPWFHGSSTTRWEGDTLVVESTGFDERTYVTSDGWFHSAALRVTERPGPR